ncbi:2TM domain-containing protein [Lacinutrix sp.]|uniref:2TM domain-containing protein n=1 Tax=Lacinutrix sp. TaxID=1937692 RepID=UPI0025BAFCFB|nr:2TM domain-containing protein [Lacinutrix sp.]
MEPYNIEPFNDPQSNYEREEAYLRAKKRVKKIVGFYWHLFWYVLVNIFIVFTTSQHLNGEDFWSIRVFSTPIFWGIGLVFHFMGVFGPNFMFSKAWEKRKIEKIMDDEEKRWE